MPRATSSTNVIATIGIDIGKNTFHVIGLDDKGAVILRHKLSRGQVYARLANIPPCLIGMEACVGAHHLGRQLSALGHDTRLMPARYVRPYSKGQKNDFRDAEAIAEAVQRPTSLAKSSGLLVEKKWKECISASPCDAGNRVHQRARKYDGAADRRLEASRPVFRKA